jgi:acetate kinase
MRVLVLNAGSSSLKWRLYEGDRMAGRGTVDRIEGRYLEAIPRLEVDGVGHRVVHGGERFHASALIDAEVEAAIEACCPLAPLHNPHNLAVYRACRQLMPGVPQVAVFDTAFFQTLKPEAFLYGLPWEFYERHRIRRYGFHGTSHRWSTARAAALFPGRELKVIICHLGSGCSVAAVKGGEAVDVSLGFTPMEGLMMGTRSGDLDPGVIFHLGRTLGMTLEQMERMLNHESGLIGLSGISNDMRDLASSDDPRARVAVDVFCHRVKKYIGAFWAVLNGADVLVFTGGIGENRPEIRARICAGLDVFGVSLDETANEKARGPESRIGNGLVETWVIEANEELMIARDTAALLSGRATASR